ncbi:hypothetical protein HZB58_03595 [Candidatus Gottesmanbacteria bacterium]|nr:hypothetical protein [Candidatus Gottesmanbacteria bacterium]
MHKQPFYKKLFTVFFVLSLLIGAFAAPTSAYAQSNQPPADWTPPAWVVIVAQKPDAPPTFNVDGYTGVLTTFILERAEALDMLDDEVEPQPFGSVLDAGEFEYFAQFCQGYTDPAWHGVCSDKIDALYLGVSRDFDGKTRLTTGEDEVYVVVTGLYPESDPTLGGKLIRYLVEGDTGIYLVKPETTVTIPTASAYFKLSNWTGETTPRAGKPVLTTGYVKAKGTVALSKIEAVLDAYEGEAKLFSELDILANKNSNARVRYGYHAFIENGKKGQTFVWTQLGQVGDNFGLVDSADGMGLYVALADGKLEVMHPFSSLTSDKPLPSYTDLDEVTAAKAPADRKAACVNNTDYVETMNDLRQSDELYLMQALYPSTVYSVQPDGKFNAKWNTIIISRGDVSGTNVILPLDWTNTSDGFAGTSFVMTDGTAKVQAQIAVICLKSALSPADAFEDWWGDQ